jgi:hypothetical protein
MFNQPPLFDALIVYYRLDNARSFHNLQLSELIAYLSMPMHTSDIAEHLTRGDLTEEPSSRLFDDLHLVTKVRKCPLETAYVRFLPIP